MSELNGKYIMRESELEILRQAKGNLTQENLEEISNLKKEVEIQKLTNELMRS